MNVQREICLGPMGRRGLALILGGVLCAPLSVGWAQEAGDAAESPEADTVFVTGKRPDRTAFDTPAGTNVISEERLRELNPTQTAEALRNQPGVWVQRTGHGGGAPILRGFMGNRVVYLFDGVRRNTASIFGGPNGYLNNTDPMTTRRVEVIRGAGSVLYGSDAIGGVVNVITAAPIAFSKDGLHPTGNLRSAYSTVDGALATSAEAGLVTSDLMINAGGGYTDIGDVTIGGGDVLKPTSSNHRSADAQIAYKLGTRDSVELITQYFKRPEGTRFDRPTKLRESEREMAVMRYRGRGHGPLRRIFAEAYFHRQSAVDTDTEKPDKKRDTLEDSVGGEVRATSRIEGVELTYGAHYHHDDMNRELPKKKQQDPHVTYDNPAAYLLGRSAISERLELEAGLRFDYMRLKSDAPDGTKVPLGLEAADLSVDRTNMAFTGGFGAVLHVNDWINWVFSAGTAFRAPGKSDYLRAGAFTFGYGVPPKGDLKPERSWSVETGVRTNHRRFESAFNVFYTVVTDVMVSEPTTFKGSKYVDSDEDGNTGAAEDADGDDQTAIDEEAYAKTNAEKASAYGVEASMRAWLIDQLALYGNATVMWGIQGKDKTPLDRAIPPNATVGLRWQNKRFNHDYFAELEAFGAAPFDRLDPNRVNKDVAFKVDPQDRNSDSMLVNDRTMPDFLVFNARVGAHIADHVDLNLSLENLADSRYRVKDSRLDAPGFNARFGLTGRF